MFCKLWNGRFAASGTQIHRRFIRSHENRPRGDALDTQSLNYSTRTYT